MEHYRINKVWVDDAHVWAETTNGWKANYPFNRWSRLAKATREQRQRFFLRRYEIHWPELDEDLSFSGLFSDAGLCNSKDDENAIYYSAN